MLTAQNAHSPEETFEEIELFYDMTLPDSFKKVYLTMTNPNPALRPSPSQLTTIIQPLIDDIQIQNLFHPMQLINITLPEWF